MISILFIVFVLNAVNCEYYEGDGCDLYGVRGVCKNLVSCPTAIADIKSNISPKLCGFVQNDAIVCCKITDRRVLTTTMRTSRRTTTEYTPKEYEYVDVTASKRTSLSNATAKEGAKSCAPIPQVLTSSPTGQKAWDKCIEYQEKYVFPCEKGVALSGDFGRVNRCHHNADELILGGTAAALNEFPHMVLLGYQFAENNIAWKCGGALISEKFVLTAAHCTADTRRNNVSHALVGALKRSDDTPSNRYEIKRIIPHELYHSPEKYHDIALLELDRPVPLDHMTVPACLHTGEVVDASRASATGWGTTNANREANSNVLRKVILTKFNSSECSAEYYEGMRLMQEGYQESSQLCYGDRTRSQDTCSGDSGGPLQVKSSRIVCMYTIVGVTSFGQACGWVGVPGIYTRVANYLPWIESVVWPN